MYCVVHWGGVGWDKPLLLGKGRHVYMSSLFPAVVVGVIVLVVMVRWYVHSKETEMRSVYIMVDRILGKLFSKFAWLPSD